MTTEVAEKQANLTRRHVWRQLVLCSDDTRIVGASGFRVGRPPDGPADGGLARRMSPARDRLEPPKRVLPRPRRRGRLPVAPEPEAERRLPTRNPEAPTAGVPAAGVPSVFARGARLRGGSGAAPRRGECERGTRRSPTASSPLPGFAIVTYVPCCSRAPTIPARTPSRLREDRPTTPPPARPRPDPEGAEVAPW